MPLAGSERSAVPSQHHRSQPHQQLPGLLAAQGAGVPGGTSGRGSDSDPAWRGQPKHVFVLSNAGLLHLPSSRNLLPHDMFHASQNFVRGWSEMCGLLVECQGRAGCEGDLGDSGDRSIVVREALSLVLPGEQHQMCR